MTGDWIAEARAYYEERPWISWALAAKIPIYEPLFTLADCANALIDHLSPVEAIDAAVGAEVRATAEYKSRAFMLVRAVANFLREDDVDKTSIVTAMDAAYRARGIEIL